MDLPIWANFHLFTQTNKTVENLIICFYVFCRRMFAHYWTKLL